jgi:PAS domain S-box-containing protein
MATPIRVLVVEDSEDDALLILREMKKGGYNPEWHLVGSPEELSEALDKGPWDIILSDFQMPGFDGREALRIVRQKGMDIPFIVISGVLVEDNAVEILKAGANDYVRKGNWARLIPAVERELHEANSRKARKRAQKERTKAQEQYRILFESAVEGIFQSTPSGRIVNANPAMARLFGYETPEELLAAVTNITYQLYVRSDTREDLLSAVRTTGTVSGFETEFFRKDGSCIWISINCRGVLDKEGNLELIEGFAMDITERKRAEADLAEMNRQLERLVTERTLDLEHKALELEMANLRLKEMDQLKTTFLSSVSHELRTPLTSVLGFAKLIHRDFCKTFLPISNLNETAGKMGDRICCNLDIIVYEGERLTRLVNDFLDLTRIEAGRMTWNDQTVNPSEILEHAAKAVSSLYAMNPDLKLKMAVPDNLPTMTIDPDRLTQVVINLLNNAAKFTPKGSVTLRAEPDKTGTTLKFQVEDTGVGIPTKDIHNIFTKFHQVKGQKTMDLGTRGSGLGLSISKQIVEHYGGKISVESKVGQGSTFLVILPLEPNPDLFKDKETESQD